jgi:hypothetical protein
MGGNRGDKRGINFKLDIYTTVPASARINQRTFYQLIFEEWENMHGNN